MFFKKNNLLIPTMDIESSNFNLFEHILKLRLKETKNHFSDN